MKRNPSAHSPRGVSLIEAMMAMVVFVVGILGILQMNVLASQQNNLAKGETNASKIGRDLVQAFERLPYEHPLFQEQAGVNHLDTSFTDFENTTGRFLLQEANTITVAESARPLVSAAMATVALENEQENRNGFGNFEVAWRSAALTDPDNPATIEARVIVVMVRFRTVGGNFRQVNTWTVKYSPAAIIDASAVIQEI